MLWSLAMLGVTLLAAFTYVSSPRFADGIHYEVFAENLEAVSALTFDGTGDLFATLEKHHGQGQLMQIRDGKAREVLGGLSKPDGILLQDGVFYITNEEGPHGLVAFASGVRRNLDGTFGAEGIASAGNGKILEIEDDKSDGRMLRIDPATSGIEVLLDGLKEAEGICQNPSGEIFYAEKTSDSLWRYTNGQSVSVVSGLVKPGFLNCLADGSILITEDRTNFGRLLRYRDGAIEVLARFLKSPQSAIVGADGAYYLAEQRRNRILKVYGF